MVNDRETVIRPSLLFQFVFVLRRRVDFREKSRLLDDARDDVFPVNGHDMHRGYYFPKIPLLCNKGRGSTRFLFNAAAFSGKPNASAINCVK